MEGRGNTEVCKLVVHRRRQIGSGSQVVRVSESKANSLHTYYCHLPFAYNQLANLCIGDGKSSTLTKRGRAHKDVGKEVGREG